MRFKHLPGDRLKARTMRQIILVVVGVGLNWAGCDQLTRAQVSSQSTDLEGRRQTVREMADTLKRRDAADAAPPKGWQPTKTSWGDPNIEGVYTNVDEWGIPFERPPEFAGRRIESITPEELAQLREARRDAWLQRLATETPAEPGTIGWYENLNVKNSRAWLIVDPPDGRIPALTPAGQRRAETATEAQSRPRADSYADQTAYARCISRGFPGSMMPEAYGDVYQVHQGPGYVAIRYEQIHETRVVPLDGRSHASRAIQMYMGDPRGHWDRDTLVVETTNFREQLSYGPSSLRLAFRGVDSAALRLMERFKPIGPKTIEWSVTVDNASTWTRPWTFAMNLTGVARGQQPYEYACHEGNYGLRNMLGAARTLEERDRR
jgi:hypothetical protein